MDLVQAHELHHQADDLFRQGRYHDAIPLAKKVLTLRERMLGPENILTIQSLNLLALMYERTGFYEEALALFHRALKNSNKLLAPDHPEIGTILSNMARLHYQMGEYERAESLSKRSLSIYEHALGEDHPFTAESLNNLAVLYMRKGAYRRAEPLLKKASTIYENELGPEHPFTADPLNNLAALYEKLGALEKAEQLYIRSLGIDGTALGSEHPDVAIDLSNLASFYANSGFYSRAKPIAVQALAVFQKAYGPEHSFIALALNGLASIHQSMGDDDQAKQLFKHALGMGEKTFGSKHPQLILFLNNLAHIYSSEGEFDKADQFYQRAQAISAAVIDQILGYTDEDRKLQFLATQQPGFEAAVGLLVFHLADQGSTRKRALDLWLRRKGIVLEAQKRFQEAFLYGANQETTEVFQRLAQFRSELSQLIFGGPGEGGADAYQRKIAELEEEIRKLEAKLAHLSRAFARKKEMQKIDSQKVAQLLPRGSVLLEFLKISPFNYRAKGEEPIWLPEHYVAFVLHAKQGERIELIHLGEAEPIDTAIARLKKAISHSSEIHDRGVRTESRLVYDLVFAKLVEGLGEAKEIFISPDGNLNLIPFEILQKPDGRYLIEDYTFNYLASGRDVIGFGQMRGENGPPLLMGDPAFDLIVPNEEKPLNASAQPVEEEWESTPKAPNMRGFHFPPLPGTREEVVRIRDILDGNACRLYVQEKALEEVLFALKKPPQILHLATHGFFLEDAEWKNFSKGTRGLGLYPLSDPSFINPFHPISDNPLLRSGIALAGANDVGGSKNANRGDGLLTAEKILGLNLWGTDLVVLSACNTGVGEVKSSEGVYGLRRAFLQAGAQSLVMSMWSVPDEETKEIMIQFYQNIRSGKMNRCQALRQAALREMEIVKKRYGHSNPLFWRGFLFLGDPEL